MKKPKQNPPKFKTEAEEREYWQSHDSADQVDWSAAQFIAFSNLRPSTVSISLRLPKRLLTTIRSEANRRDVPYQSLMKLWLTEKVDEERDKIPATMRHK
mgnify:CR=1 FL=1